MYKILRIVFTVLSALFILPVVLIGIYLGLGWAIACAAAAAAFFGLAVLFKRFQEREEEKKNPPPPVGDFFSPLPKTGQADRGDAPDQKQNQADLPDEKAGPDAEEQTDPTRSESK